MKKFCAFLFVIIMMLNLAVGVGAEEISSVPDEMPAESLEESTVARAPLSDDMLDEIDGESGEISLLSPDETVSQLSFPSSEELAGSDTGHNGYTRISSDNPQTEPLDFSNAKEIDLRLAEELPPAPAALPANQPPTGTPEIIIVNPESMKGDQYTTASMFLIVTKYNGQDLVYDPEGGPISIAFNDSFPAGYIKYYPGNVYEGFLVHMFNIGSYQLTFAFTDQVGDMSANTWTMNFDIIRRGDYEILEDSFSSAADVNEYPITVDFSKESSYAVGIWRTGCCGANMEVFDAAGVSIGYKYITSQGTDESISAKLVLNRPAGGADVCHYTVRVSTTQDFFDNTGSDDMRYQVAYGGLSQAKYFFEDVTSNTKALHYTTKREIQQNSNTYQSYLGDVSDYGNWYKMVAQGTESVTMSIGRPDQLAFRIVDVNSMQTLYDNIGASYYQNTEIGSYFTRATIRFTAGQTYYIVVYALGENEARDASYNISVGDRRALFGSATYHIPRTAMTAGGNYQWTFEITPPVGKDAYAHKILFGGSSATWAIEGGYFEVQRPGAATWQQNSPKFYPDINYNYTKLTSPLVPATGTWKLRIKCAQSGVYPGRDLVFQYYFLF